jgi:hypothetical protein
MILQDNQSTFAIKHNGSILGTYPSKQAAEFALVSLKSNALYENAHIAVMDNNQREMLLG